MITSIPCFEYWLLLHFIYTRRVFHATGNQSACEIVIRDLIKKQRFNNYQKGQRNVYSLLKDKTSIAIQNAQKAENDARQTGEDNPSTRVHILVLELQNLVNSRGWNSK